MIYILIFIGLLSVFDTFVLIKLFYHKPEKTSKKENEKQIGKAERDPEEDLYRKEAENAERLFNEGVRNVLNYDLATAKKAIRGE